MWSIAPLGNEIRYRVISRLLSRRSAPAASQPRPYAVETDKPPKLIAAPADPGSLRQGAVKGNCQDVFTNAGAGEATEFVNNSGPPSDARSTGSAVRTANWLSLTRARGVSGSGATTPIGRASCSY